MTHCCPTPINVSLLEMRCYERGSSSDEWENCVMADDRYNDPFAIRDFSMGWSQWPVAGTELWAPLISGTQEWYGRFSFLTKQWDFFQRRVKENLALVEHSMSCRTPIEVWSLYIEFLQKAAADYQKEFVEFGKLGSVLCSELVTQKPKKRTSRVDEFRRTQTIQ
jgi:hypothetical protein